MDCSTVSAALVSICMSLPTLNEPTKIADYPNWQLRQIHNQYNEDKTIWRRRVDIVGAQATLAFGNTSQYREFNLYKSRQTLYLFFKAGNTGFIYVPVENSVSIVYTKDLW